MIKNSRQYGVANQQIAKLQEALELSKKYPAEMDQRLYEAMIVGIESQIEDIQKEVDEYDKLKETKVIQSDTLEHLGRQLIKARIASGYTQQELAQRVGIKSQQIQQYEAVEYKTISLSRLKKITHALQINATVDFAKSKEQFVMKNVEVMSKSEWPNDSQTVLSPKPSVVLGLDQGILKLAG